MPNLVMYLPVTRSVVCTVGPQPCLLDRMTASLRFALSTLSPCCRYRRPGTARAAEYKRLCIYCPTSHLFLFITLCHLFSHSNALRSCNCAFLPPRRWSYRLRTLRIEIATNASWKRRAENACPPSRATCEGRNQRRSREDNAPVSRSRTRPELET